MAHARLETEHQRTAELVATVANLVRPKGRKPVRASELNPYLRPRKAPEPIPAGIEALRAFLPADRRTRT